MNNDIHKMIDHKLKGINSMMADLAKKVTTVKGMAMTQEDRAKIDEFIKVNFSAKEKTTNPNE